MTPFEYFALIFTVCAILAFGLIVLHDIILTNREEKSL